MRGGEVKAASDQFVKVYAQILDSSIAADYRVRHFFEDLLKLADWRSGVVDMTPEAIGRRINMPLKEVEQFIAKLEEPDELSRSDAEDGRRIVKIDEKRAWGWLIVNYKAYKLVRTAEERREYMRDYMRERRGQKLDGKQRSYKTQWMAEHREKKKKRGKEPASGGYGPLPGERDYVATVERGEKPVDPGAVAVAQVAERKGSWGEVVGVRGNGV
jgi:hypothetical protein